MHYPEMWGFVYFSGYSAGDEVDTFHYKADELTKFALRRAYYRQRSFFKVFGEYAETVEQLDLTEMTVPGYSWPPTIRRSWNQYEAQLESETGSAGWIINQDGKIWQF